jgi:hypothetical protein
VKPGILAQMRALATLVAFAVLASCGRAAPSEPSPGGSAQTVVSPAPSTVPADHLAPGELVAGPQNAFGVALPRDVLIDRDQAGSVRAFGPVSVHALVKYFQPRVLESHLTEGDTYATLEQVKLSGKPGQVFRIRLTELPPRGTMVDLDDVTPPPPSNLPDDAARWKQVGLSPQGKVLDPTHLD